MYEGNKAELNMEKAVAISTIPDEGIHVCKVLRYDPEEDYICLLLEKEDLQTLLLDAKYRCDIFSKSEVVTCTGVLKERFHNETGNILNFKIENGFYIRPKSK